MPVQWIGQDLFARVLEEARRSPRRRMNYNFHESLDENAHRLLNVLLEGTYIRPHRHLDPPKPESFLVLEGEIAIFIFDDDGAIVSKRIAGRNGLWGVDIPAGLWHTIAAVTPHAICHEVKPGPYSPATDKAFASWAPREGEAGVAEMLERLMQAPERG